MEIYLAQQVRTSSEKRSPSEAGQRLPAGAAARAGGRRQRARQRCHRRLCRNGRRCLPPDHHPTQLEVVEKHRSRLS